MHIARLNLTNFRNYRQLELKLPPHMVVIQGDNAQGKTNLLEAIHVVATTKSHRAASDRELIHQDAAREDLPFARITADVERAQGNLNLEIILRLEGTEPVSNENAAGSKTSTIPLRKRVKVNHVARRAAELVGQANVVMFSAQDIDLVSGAPALCRRYLNLFNSQIDPAYLRSLQRYARVLVQRNHLLRLVQEHKAQADQLEFWDNELVESGTYLVLQRQHSVTALNRLAQGIHWEISSQTERLEVAYISNIGIEEGLAGVESRFRQALRQIRRREIAQGMTLAGPHRDGLQFKVNKADMSKYGSRGQQQTIAISLKLAEAQHMYAEVGDYPIMLLDDVFSELDRYRRQHLLESIAPFQQVLISAVDLDCFEPSCLARADHFRVRQGIIESA